MSKDLDKSALKQDIETAQRAAAGHGKKALEDMYQGFFGSRENCEIFAKQIPNEVYAIENPVIVDAGSSQGTLGNYVREKFPQHGRSAQLVMIDANAVAMEQSPIEARKVVGNLIENPLPSEFADLVILRSVLHYVETEDQIKILEEIKRVLKTGGVLISQFASCESQQRADAVNRMFDLVRHVKFCGREEGVSMHEAVFGGVDEVAEGPVFFETLDDFFVTRIQASEEQVATAKRYICEHLEELGDTLTSTTDPYAWEIPFTIVRCKKRSSYLNN